MTRCRCRKLTVLFAATALLYAAVWPAKRGKASPGLPRLPNSASPAAQASVPTGVDRTLSASPSDDGNSLEPQWRADNEVALPAARAIVPALQTPVDELVRWAAARNGRVGVAVMELSSGRLLAAHEESVPLNPASNIKLVTTAVALHHLGAGYRYSTGIYGRLSHGRVERLVLRGHGDPTLSDAQLWVMAQELVGMGLERVGALEVDSSRFDDVYVPPAFEQQPEEWASFRAPVSAVSLDRNSLTLSVLAAESGTDARVWVEPAGFVEVQGRIETLPRGTREEVRLALVPSGKRLVARVGGHVPEGGGRLQYSRRVDDPTLFAGYALREVLRRLGVEVEGEVRRGSGEEKHRLVYVVSPPLRELLDELGKESDNFYAEMLLKTVGAEVIGQPARTADGATVAVEWLKGLRAFPRGSRIVNGSGLFDANRLSAMSLVQVLRQAYADTLTRPEFLSQLAIGGVDGTLRSRFKEPAVRGRVRAKTGTLAAVDALSGYVMPPDGRSPIAFSMLVNGVSDHGAARTKLDAVVAALSRYVWR